MTPDELDLSSSPSSSLSSRNPTIHQPNRSHPHLSSSTSSDLLYLRESLQKLSKEFDSQREMYKSFQDSYYRVESLIQELEENFKQMTQPLISLLSAREADLNVHHYKVASSYNRKETDRRSSGEEETKTVSINNLNEFICEGVLSEYLRQNGIFVLKCTKTLAYNERSRNFFVTVRSSDLDRLLLPDLWPKGVTLSVRGEYKTPSVHGGRDSKDMPGVIISPGMSYWHS